MKTAAVLSVLPIAAVAWPTFSADNEPRNTRGVFVVANQKLNIAPGCWAQIGNKVPDLQPNLANPTRSDVEKAVVQWLNDVCTVDSFLNKPVGGPTDLKTTIVWAEDEPTQLKTLSSVIGLSDAGKAAAAVLEANFPAIPNNLHNVQNGLSNAKLATTAINFSRCCIVLPAIKTLVEAASQAVGAFANSAVPEPQFPNPCLNIACESGSSKM